MNPNPAALDDQVAVLNGREPVLLLSGDGVFTTIQGEGPAAGQPATFVRLAACNLKCGINGGWHCDSAYTWDYTGLLGHAYDKAAEVAKTTVSGLLDLIPRTPDLVVVTGGEPLLQDAMLAVLLKALRDRGHTIHMETNGTLRAVHTGPLVDLFVVSPKLASSGNPAKQRTLEPAWLVHPRAALKFVITREHRTDDIAEVLRLCGGASLGRRNIWLMPEGTTPESVIEGAQALAAVCQWYGFNLSLRQHILLFGDRRGT